jgi:hypothetical protein
MKSIAWRVLAAWVAGASLLASATGCGAEAEGQASPDPNEGATYSGAVTAAAGGTVETAGGTAAVTVPPGAVPADTTLTIAVAAAEVGTATSVYDLGPNGTRFGAWVTVSIRYGGTPGPGQEAVLAWKDGETWTRLPGSGVNGGSVTGRTTHFTRFSVILVGDDDVSVDWQGGTGDESTMTYTTWTDSSSGLTWQYPTAVNWMDWQEAVAYCANLSLDGGGWHLPTIGELRSLVRDCAATRTGGACGVTDACPEQFACWGESDVCNGCGDGGCNWDPALFFEKEPQCLPAYWSSTTYLAVPPGRSDPPPADDQTAWALMYAGGGLLPHPKQPAALKVRCIRAAP